MYKIVYPDANENLFEALQGKFATVITDDKFYTNIKKASSSLISEKMLEDCKPDKDHFLIHFVSVGDYERYGFNKNADAFPKFANQKYYKTFETDAKLYREHNSSDPKNAIGEIKLACYNPDMGRIECAVWANIKKASQEYETAKSGGALSCSMGMKCPCDRDSISGKFSKTPAFYEPWMKQCPGQYIESWNGIPIRKYAFVYNDDFKFFDLSIVGKPAERIARYLEYKFASSSNEMRKAAATNIVNLPGALIPEEMGIHFASVILPLNKSQLLNRLVQLEKDFGDALFKKEASQSKNSKYQYIKNVAINSYYKLASSEAENLSSKVEQLKVVRPETLTYELAKRASILSFEDFMKVFYSGTDTSKKPEYNSAIKYANINLIPAVFKNLSDSILNKTIECPEEIFDAGSAMQCELDSSKDPVQKLMDEVENKTSIAPDKVGNRVMQITISIGLPATSDENSIAIVKQASSVFASENVKSLAKRFSNEYGMYKLSALNDVSTSVLGNLDDYTLYSTIAQNFYAI